MLMKYQVIYISKTGNTEKIAKKIFEVLPGMEKDIMRFDPGMEIGDADVVWVGFCVNRGTCSMDLLDYLSELHEKKIVLFGTCGMGSDASYYKRIMDEIVAWIPDDSECLGTFMCQGKMPMSIREKYESMLGNGNDGQLQALIRNFDEALLRPDKDDLKHTAEFVNRMLEKI
ncbi:MAG: flavodoxin family protein [Lachnospiraceae bacterium]|nr:flavodoxin family protein [Lachnospiraceae bacterium]